MMQEIALKQNNKNNNNKKSKKIYKRKSSKAHLSFVKSFRLQAKTKKIGLSEIQNLFS